MNTTEILATIHKRIIEQCCDAALSHWAGWPDGTSVVMIDSAKKAIKKWITDSKVLEAELKAIITETKEEDASIITDQLSSFNPDTHLPDAQMLAHLLRESILNPNRRLTDPATGPTEAQFYVNTAYVTDVQAAHAALDKAGVPKERKVPNPDLPGAIYIESIPLADRVEWLVKNIEAGKEQVRQIAFKVAAGVCIEIINGVAVHSGNWDQVIASIRAKYGLQTSPVSYDVKHSSNATIQSVGWQISKRHAISPSCLPTNHEEECAAEIDAAVEQARKETDLAWMRRSSESLRGLRMVIIDQFPEPLTESGRENEYAAGFNDAIGKCAAVVQLRPAPSTKSEVIKDYDQKQAAHNIAVTYASPSAVNACKAEIYSALERSSERGIALGMGTHSIPDMQKNESLLRAKIFSQLPEHKNESGGSERDYGYNTALYECRLIVLGKPETATEPVKPTSPFGCNCLRWDSVSYSGGVWRGPTNTYVDQLIQEFTHCPFCGKDKVVKP